MSDLNRRRFLQIAGAAGLAPALPALTATTAVAAPVGTSSQMLWASLYQRSAALDGVAGVARTMGVSGTAANGVLAKLVEVNVVAAQTAANIARAVPTVSAAKPLPSVGAVETPRIKVDVVKFLTEDSVEQEELDSLDAQSDPDGAEAVD